MKDMTRATFAKLALTTIALTVVMSLIMVNINWMGLDGSVEKGKIEQAWPKISPKDTPANLLKALAS